MFNYEEIVRMWNAEVDAFNQWDNLSDEEKVNFTILVTRDKCASICDELALASEPDDFALDALNKASEKILDI